MAEFASLVLIWYHLFALMLAMSDKNTGEMALRGWELGEEKLEMVERFGGTRKCAVEEVLAQRPCNLFIASRIHGMGSHGLDYFLGAGIRH
jgi:hypothetical protein